MASKTISGLLFTKNLLVKADADSFPLMSDPKQIATMKLLDLLASYSYQANNVLMLLFATVKMVRLTVQYGLSTTSPSSVAMYGGLVSGVLNDLKAGVHIGEMSLAMVKRLNGQANESLVIARTWGFMLGYSRPSHDALKQYLHGYSEGMKFGDTEMSSWCLYNHAACSFLIGKPLRTIEEDCRIYIPYMQDLGWAVVGKGTTHILQAVSYLSGSDEDLYSELFEPVEGEPKFSDLTRFMVRSAAYAYSSNYEDGAEYAIEIGDALKKGAPGHTSLQSDAFTRAVCLYAMARKTNKQKYKKPARAIRKIIGNWIKQGSVNTKHQLCLLDAEDEALRNKKDKASNLYREGIVTATRQGFLRDAALINERYANFLLHEVGDKYQAKYHAKQSMKLYSEWGATRTVERLNTMYHSLTQDNVPDSVYFRGPASNAANSALTLHSRE